MISQISTERSKNFQNMGDLARRGFSGTTRKEESKKSGWRMNKKEVLEHQAL